MTNFEDERMLWKSSLIDVCEIDATDGRLGKVLDILCAAANWRMRWLVVDTRHWLPGRKVLIHPSALQRPDPVLRTLPVGLTKQQVRESPELGFDQPISWHLESNFFDHYDWDRTWADHLFPAGAEVSPFFPPMQPSGLETSHPGTLVPLPSSSTDLLSLKGIVGLHVHAKDGAIGHVEDFLADDASWGIRYFIIDTRNWWPGERVIVAPVSIHDIRWDDKVVELDMTKQRVRTSPRYDPDLSVDRPYEELLHRHYDWQGYWLKSGDHTGSGAIAPPYLDA
jgi:hypothetical protein